MNHRRRRTDGCRILVVEDNDDLRQLMEMALAHEGYDVDTADSAEAGVQLMERGRYDLVLTDYMLPNRTGAWLLREAHRRRLLDGAATLLVTADPDAPEIAPEQGVVTKPVDFDRFLPQIRGILGQGLDQGFHASPPSPVDQPEAIDLVLYTSPGSIASARAQRVLREVLAQYDERRIRLQITDMALHPDDAARDRVIYTPTLVKRAPAPVVWLLGDFSHRETLTDLLQMCGLEPATSLRTR